jgi:hypothetical protein
MLGHPTPRGAFFDGVDFLRGDFTEIEGYEALLALTKGKKVDTVRSDMAPNMSGQLSVDTPGAAPKSNTTSPDLINLSLSLIYSKIYVFVRISARFGNKNTHTTRLFLC